MKRAIINLIAVITIFTVGTAAFADSNHLLVFRHSGSIECLDLSELTSIELTELDENGISHGQPVSQIFRLGEKSIIIPIEDIDSVSFSDRNLLIAKPDARRIEDSELRFITGYDGETLVYSLDTPSASIPNAGEKVYHDNFCEVFPFGLCALINDRKQTSMGYELSITEIEPGEVFEEYIVSGDYDYVPSGQGTRAELEGGLVYDSEFEYAPVRLKTKATGGLSFKNFVGCPKTDYYSADIYLNNNLELECRIMTDDSRLIELESPSLTVARGVIAGVLQPQLDFNLFCDIEASLSLGVKLSRSSSLHYHWVKDKNGNRFELIEDENNKSEDDPTGATTTVDLLLEGIVHFGPQADLSLNTLFNRAGVGIRTKLGPEFKGEFGAGMIDEMEREYNPTYYAKAKINTALVAKIETYMYHLENILMGDRVETKLPFKAEARFFERPLNLLPEFKTKAVRVNGRRNPFEPSRPEKMIDIAAITTDTVIRDLEMAFRLTDKSTGTAIGEVNVVQPVLANSRDIQGFNQPIPYSGSLENVEVNPIIRYAGKELLGSPTVPIEGAAINSIFATTVSSACYGVGGAPIMGQKTTEKGTSLVGNILPVANVNPALKNVFKKKRSFKTISFVDEEGRTTGGTGFSIFGTWEGEHDGNLISLNLASEEEASSFNEEKCMAFYNYPQIGIIVLRFGDGRDLILRVEEFGRDYMAVYFGNSEEKVTLQR